MDKKKSIADLIEEAVDEVIKYGDTPYVIICNKKTWEKVALYFRKLSPIEEKVMPLQIWFRYDFGDLPVLKFKCLPDDRIYVLNKFTYTQLMRQTKGKFAMTTHIGIEALPLDEQKKARKTHSVFDKHPCELLKKNVKPVIYKARGLKLDLGKKTIIKRIG